MFNSYMRDSMPQAWTAPNPGETRFLHTPPPDVHPAVEPKEAVSVPVGELTTTTRRIGMRQRGIRQQNEEGDGVPQRPPANANLLIDSEDRYTSLSAKFGGWLGQQIPGNDFIISRKQALLYGYFTRLTISQIQLNYRIPTIYPGINNELLFETNAVKDIIVTLDSGYYDASGLAQEIQQKVLAIVGTPIPDFTCIYSPFVGGMVMTSSAGFSIGVQNVIGDTSDADKKLWSHTAYTIGANISNAQASTTQVLSTPNLLYTKYIDIVSDRLTKFQRVKDADTNLINKTNVVARIYLTAPNTRVDPNVYGGPFNICWDPNSAKNIKWSPNETINELDFRLYDEFGDLIPWNEINNTEFQITILASET